MKQAGIIGMGVALTATLCSTIYLFLENKKLKEDNEYLQDKLIDFSEYVYELEQELINDDYEENEEEGKESSSDETEIHVNKDAVENIFDTNPVYPVSNKFIPESDVIAARERLHERMMKNKALYERAIRDTDMELIDNTEEDYIEVDGMRYDPNSEEAWEAYKRMRLSDIANELDPNFNDQFIALQRDFSHKYNVDMIGNPDDLFEKLENLFEYDAPLRNAHDNNYRSLIYDKRYEFFGPNSRYTNMVSFGEVILEIVEQILDNLEIQCRTIIIERIFTNMDIYDSTPAHIGMTISEIMSHNYYGDLGYGLFGIDKPESITPIAEQRTIHDEIVLFTNDLIEYSENM